MRSLPLADRAERHEQRDAATLTHATDDLASIVENARDAIRLQAFEIIQRRRMAVRRKERDEGFAGNLALIVAEQRFARAVDREDPASVVENDDAVCRRVEDFAKLPRLSLAPAKVLFHSLEPRLELGIDRAPERHQRCRQSVPLDRLHPRLDSHDLGIAPGQSHRAVLAGAWHLFDRPAAKQAQHTAFFVEGVDRLITEQIEKVAVHHNRHVATADENSERKPVEDQLGVQRQTGQCRRGGDLRLERGRSLAERLKRRLACDGLAFRRLAIAFPRVGVLPPGRSFQRRALRQFGQELIELGGRRVPATVIRFA